ncbi:hypothetical protein DICA3_E20186 [Diutina catenulata]
MCMKPPRMTKARESQDEEKTVGYPVEKQDTPPVVRRQATFWLRGGVALTTSALVLHQLGLF